VPDTPVAATRTRTEAGQEACCHDTVRGPPEAGNVRRSRIRPGPDTVDTVRRVYSCQTVPVARLDTGQALSTLI